MDVFSAGLDPPRGEGIGGQTGLEPIGEGLRVREVGIVGGFGRGGGKGHIRDSKEPARV